MPTTIRPIHDTESPFARGYYYLNDNAMDPIRDIVVPGSVFHVEDWWDRLGMGSWKFASGNFAAMHYALRGIHLPIDDEVVYGHIGAFGHIIHISEIGQPLTTAEVMALNAKR